MFGTKVYMAFATDLTTAEAFQAEVINTPGILQGDSKHRATPVDDLQYLHCAHAKPASPFHHAVVECYAEWAGPCKAITSTLKTLYFSYSDRPIKFYTVGACRIAPARCRQ